LSPGSENSDPRNSDSRPSPSCLEDTALIEDVHTRMRSLAQNLLPLTGFGVHRHTRRDTRSIYLYRTLKEHTGGSMPAEQQKALVRRFIDEVWNKGDLAVIDQVCAPDFVLHDPANPRVKTRLEYEKLVATYRQAFPDLRCAIEEQIAERD